MTENPINVLAVDDEELNLEIIELTLRKNGYTVDCVSDGGKALVLLNSNPQKYDVLLLDRMMPEIDGMEVFARIQNNPNLSHLPVIMQTAASNKQQVEEGVAAGVHIYLSKPYSKQALLDAIEAAMHDDSTTPQEARIF